MNKNSLLKISAVVLLALPVLAGAEASFKVTDSSSDPVDVQIDAMGVKMDSAQVEVQNVGTKEDYQKWLQTSGPKTVQAADLDRDGRPDLKVAVGGSVSVDSNDPTSANARVLPTVNKREAADSNDPTAGARQTPKTDFGTRVRVVGWDPDRKEAIEQRVKKVVEADPNIAKSEIEEGKIKISYRRPAKLFGFIPVAYYHAFTMDGKGNLAQGKPWWLALATSDAKQFADDVSAAYQNNQSNLDFLRLQDLVARQSRAFEVLSGILKVRHDSAMNAIRNMK